MIEDNIRMLRQAARITSDDEPIDNDIWCVIAGNVDLIDDIAYKAIASKNSVKILFREHVVLNEGKICMSALQSRMINLCSSFQYCIR